MILTIEELYKRGGKFYVQSLHVDRPIQHHDARTFEKLIGTVKEYNQHARPYRIYFSKIDNSYLCHGDQKINVYLEDLNPEYFL